MPSNAEYRPEVLDVLRELFAADAEVQLGQMMGHPVFYHAPPGGKRKMFACVYGPGVALKLPAELVAELLGSPGFSPFAPGGTPMRGWVVAEFGAAEEALEAEDLVRQALDFVAAQ